MKTTKPKKRKTDSVDDFDRLVNKYKQNMLTKSDKSKWFDRWSAVEDLWGSLHSIFMEGVLKGHLLLISMEGDFVMNPIYVPMYVQNEKFNTETMSVQCWLHEYMYVHILFIVLNLYLCKIDNYYKIHIEQVGKRSYMIMKKWY